MNFHWLLTVIYTQMTPHRWRHTDDATQMTSHRWRHTWRHTGGATQMAPHMTPHMTPQMAPHRWRLTDDATQMAPHRWRHTDGATQMTPHRWRHTWRQITCSRLAFLFPCPPNSIISHLKFYCKGQQSRHSTSSRVVIFALYTLWRHYSTHARKNVIYLLNTRQIIHSRKKLK